ncbi:unnamed protein product [Malus baccata var. baccata]
MDARYSPQDIVSTTITVDKRGIGNFVTVQPAIDSVPTNSQAWTRVVIEHGTYFSATSFTFELFAENFVARNIVFKNVHDRLLIDPDASKRTAWAPAALIQADKASFYNCSFIGLQDTLTDFKGRHYFITALFKGRREFSALPLFIIYLLQGAMDFIWGNGQSIYEVVVGYITAQGRDNPNDSTGFVFKDCHIFGTVLFASTYMENVINPEGWSAWHPSVMGCTGLEANMTHRVEWEKQSPPEEVAYWTNTASFIDQDGWLERQPH